MAPTPDPTDENKQKKNLYSTKHDFMAIQVGQLPKTIEIALKSSKVLAIVGHAGIGKTQMVAEAARNTKIEWPVGSGKMVAMKCRPIFTSQKVPEDFSGIPVPDMEAGVVRFLKLEELPTPSDPPTVVFFDEINQADHVVQRTIFQLLGERRLGTYTLAPQHRLLAALNPDGTNYQTAKPSPALRRRMIWVEVNFDKHAWINWASHKPNFNPAVLDYCRRNPSELLNADALANDKVFANPASWEHVSDICNCLTSEDTPEDALPLFGGAVGLKIANKFTKFLSQYQQDLDPRDIVYKYMTIRKKIQKIAKAGRVDQLKQLSNAVNVEMLGVDMKDKKWSDILNNVAHFYVDLPNDVAVEFGRETKETFKANNRTRDYDTWQKGFMSNPATRQKMMKMLTVAVDVQKGPDGDDDEDDD